MRRSELHRNTEASADQALEHVDPRFAGEVREALGQIEIATWSRPLHRQVVLLAVQAIREDRGRCLVSTRSCVEHLSYAWRVTRGASLERIGTLES